MRGLHHAIKGLWSGIVFGCVFGLLGMLSGGSAYAQSVDMVRDKGLAWLLTNQNADGSWGSQIGTEVVATSEAVQALWSAGVRNYSYSAGIAWLSVQKSGSVDALARKILALRQAGVKVSQLVQELKDRKNSFSSWGSYDRWELSFPDTALVVSAFRKSGESQSEMSQAWNDMAAYQLTTPAGAEGSWTYVGRPSEARLGVGRGSSIVPTVYNLLEIHAAISDFGQTSFSSVRSDGITWLRQQQPGDSGFGVESSSTVLETALVYRALATIEGASDTDAMTALDYLLNEQQADGSWNGEALETALVLAVLPAPSGPLPDNDGDGIPNGVEGVLLTDLNIPNRGVLVGSQPATSSAAASVLSPPVAASVGPVNSRETVSLRSVIVPDGDVNEDGAVDVADLALLDQIALGLIEPTAEQLLHGDVAPIGNPDGTIDAADVDRLGRIIVEGE